MIRRVVKKRSCVSRGLLWGIVASAVIVASVLMPYKSHGGNVDDIVFQAADYHYKGKLNEAIIEFQKAVRMDPVNEYAHNQLGILYAKKERYDDAFREFSYVVRIEERNTFALLWLGILYLQQNDLDRAYETFQKIITIDRHNADAYYFIGSIYNIRHNPLKAVEYLKKARDADSEEADTHYRLGRAFHDLSMVNNAFLEYYRTLQLKPTHTRALNEIGWIYYTQGNYKAAIAEWQKIITINARDREAISNLAKAYNELAFSALTKGKKRDAVSYWRATLAIMPKNKAAQYYLKQYR